jgi:hypothetical protein
MQLSRHYCSSTKTARPECKRLLAEHVQHERAIEGRDANVRRQLQEQFVFAPSFAVDAGGTSARKITETGVAPHTN